MNEEVLKSLLFCLFACFDLIFFVEGCCRGEGRMWGHWEVGRIGVHDMKFPQESINK